MNLSDLTPDPNNANKGTERGNSALEASLQQYGAGRSILLDKNDTIIAGNKTAEMAGQLGMMNVKVVETTGDELVAVKRTDLDLETDASAREMAYADNRVGELSLDWDADALLNDIENGIDIGKFFSDNEIDKLTSPQDDFYSQEVDVPVYEPSDKKPDAADLFDNTKAASLIAAIRASEIPEREKDFLILAAGRHVKLDFELIADYYAHSDSETQELMEDNALVIVDFNKAIENGWVSLSERLNEQYADENDDA